MKTSSSNKPVSKFVEDVPHEGRKSDALELIDHLQNITGKAPQMWGPSIIGFGSYHYVYDSGREGDMMLTGFSPRKQNLVVYIMNGCEYYKDQLKALGPHKTGKSCLYLKRLNDIDIDILKSIIEDSVRYMQQKYS